MNDLPDPVDRELEEMTSNRRKATTVKNALAKLREGVAGPELAEMATEILEGRTSLRTVGNSSVYADHFAEAATRFRDWQSSQTAEERGEAVRNAAEHLGDLDEQDRR
jgi:hypothetical protein